MSALTLVKTYLSAKENEVYAPQEDIYLSKLFCNINVNCIKTYFINNIKVQDNRIVQPRVNKKSCLELSKLLFACLS